jgi:hypothetical protein
MTMEQPEAAAMAMAATASRSATATAIAGITTMMMATSHGLVLTADQGDAHHRKKDRDAEQQGSIHSKFLQKRVPKK